MWKIIIADNHSAIRNGLKKILAAETDLTVVAEAGSVRELQNKIRVYSPDLLITNLALPGQSGIELLPFLTKKYPLLPLLVMCMNSDVHFEAAVLAEGATGFIRKENLTDHVVMAIREILAGQKKQVGSLYNDLGFF